jgi:hypothetical protein
MAGGNQVHILNHADRSKFILLGPVRPISRINFMSVISDFMELYKDQSYDRINNPNQLPIIDLLPIGISWSGGCSKIRLDFINVATVCPLSDMSGIAIVEMDNAQINKRANAYIVNADGDIRFDIKLPTWAANGIFYDVYYIGDDLCFFFYSDNYDYRMIIDTDSGIIKDILKSR